MAGRRRRKRTELVYEDAELNIMPFIDVFSVLNTFLLFSAVFVSLGSIKVQIPFFTNAEPDKENQRVLDITVDAEVEKITLITRYTRAPFNEQTRPYPNNDAGLAELHNDLVQLRTENPETDTVNLLTMSDLKWERVINIVDAIKMRNKNDPEFVNEAEATDEEKSFKDFVYPKIVMGSVILTD